MGHTELEKRVTMKANGSFVMMGILFALLCVAPVFATGYGPVEPVIAVPIVNGPSGAPALVSTQMSGIFIVSYLGIHTNLRLVIQNDVTFFKVCGTGGCTSVRTTLVNTGPDTYSYTFTIPASPTGAVTIIIPAGALTDDFGRGFPTIDTQIGAYSLPGASSSSAASAPSPGSPQTAPQETGTYRLAVQTGKVPSATWPALTQLVPVFAALGLACCGVLLVVPSKKR